MGTRVTIRGQTVHSRGMPEPGAEVPRNRFGERITDFRIEPSSPDAPFRAGVPFDDPEDGITYRVVRAGGLPPLDGWRSARFWVERWSIKWTHIRLLVEKGWLDAAIEEGSAIRLYRCRDEHRVLAWVADEVAVRKDRIRSRNTPKPPRRKRK